jgi:hypothetical protein
MITSGRTLFFILNLVLLLVYFSVFIGLPQSIGFDTMFSTNDALSYLDVANLGSNLSGTDAPAIRPFFYPLVLALSYKTCGVFGLWFLQLLFWLSTANFLFFSVKKLSNLFFAASAVILFMLNLSCITLTLHALTETLSIMLLAFLLWFIVNAAGKRNDIGFIHRVLLIFVFLSLIKPLFYPVVLFILFVILPFFYFKQYRLLTKKLITLLFILSPVFIQMSFMKAQYNTFKISLIGDITIRDYIFADGFAKVNGIDRDSALITVKDFQPKQINSYMIQHKKEFIEVFKTNIVNNCNSYPLYLDFPCRQWK